MPASSIAFTHQSRFSASRVRELTTVRSINIGTLTQFSSFWLYTVPEKSLVAWVQIDLKCPSNIFLINIILQEMAHFNLNSFWNNVLVQNETVLMFTAW